MKMELLDWTVLIGFLSGLFLVALYTRHYMRSVADFLAAGRSADRWLLTVAGGAAVGTIGVVANFQQVYAAGFAFTWWGNILGPVGLLISLSGFVIYRFRETRALTLAQFFEVRYSRRFRVFSGMLCFFSGVINYGIFPGISAKFFVYFCQFPEKTPLFWGITVPTYAIIMVILLGLALVFTFMGGQITIMITDFFTAQFFNFALPVILIYLLCTFSWKTVSEGLLMTPPGQSLVNPFQTGLIPDFNITYFFISTFTGIYSIMAWQGNQAFNASAVSPHEQKMGQVLAQWRGSVGGLVLLLLPVCAFVYMHHPQYADRAAVVMDKLSQISGTADQQKQMLVPLAMSDYLPTGFIGIFMTFMVAGFITCDDTYLHSWGSIFIQDVVLPMRKKPFTPEQHIKYLRWSIVGVAVFAFFFSLFFPMQDYILFYFAITSAIYLGGAGSAIIGGLYWKKGTTAAAFAGMSVGSCLAVTHQVIEQIWGHGKMPGVLTWFWAHLPFLQSWKPIDEVLRNLPNKFPINGQWGFFIAVLAAIAVYVTVSLIQGKEFDLDKMLHRDKKTAGAGLEHLGIIKGFLQRCGLTGPEFTRGDKFLYAITFWYGMFWTAVFVGITIYALIFKPSNYFWVSFWSYYLFYVPLTITFVTGPVFIIFGTRGVIRLIRNLKSLKRNELDDGRVVDHQNLDEAVEEKTDEVARKAI